MLHYFAFVFLLLMCRRLDAEDQPFSWLRQEDYYFKKLDAKFRLMDIEGSCSNALSIRKKLEVPPKGEVYMSSIQVNDSLVQWWHSIPPPKQHRVDPLLCEAPYQRKKPIFDNDGCFMRLYMSKSAPRCQSKYLKYICDKSQMNIEDSTPNGFFIPEANHKNTFMPPTPWILTVRDSFVTACGQISSQCGPIHTTTNCMAQTFSASYSHTFRGGQCSVDTSSFASAAEGTIAKCSATSDFPKQASNGIPSIAEVQFHRRVFVVAEVDDSYVYHIHLEIVPRILQHLDFLSANPDVKILWGCDTKDSAEGTRKGLELGLAASRPYFEMMGLDIGRVIIHQHVYAEEVYLPMEGGCQDPVYQTWQILHMRSVFLQQIGLDPLALAVAKATPATKPTMVLLRRSSGSKSTRNYRDLVRQWNDLFTNKLFKAMQAEFPSYNVVLYNDRDEKLMTCLQCQIRMFNEADVAVGMHGAGLSNIIYMKPNSAVVEFAPYGNDGRVLLGGGPFNRASILLSHDYMVHYALKEEYTFHKKSMSASFNVNRFVNHIHSFLASTGRIPAL